MRWDGTDWIHVPSPNGPGINFLWGLGVIAPGEMWTVGRTYTGSDYPSLMERWDGTAWSIVSHPDAHFYTEPYHVAGSSPDNVWAVGRRGGGFSDNHAFVSFWDGTQWTVGSNPLPAGETESFLYRVENVTVDHLIAVGAYLEGPRYKTLVMEYRDVPCASTTPVVARTSPLLSSAPNPAPERMALHFSLPVEGQVTLALFHVDGARVRTVLERASLPAGLHEVALDTRTLPVGVYFAKLEGDFPSVTHKVMIIR